MADTARTDITPLPAGADPEELALTLWGVRADPPWVSVNGHKIAAYTFVPRVTPMREYFGDGCLIGIIERPPRDAFDTPTRWAVWKGTLKDKES